MVLWQEIFSILALLIFLWKFGWKRVSKSSIFRFGVEIGFWSSNLCTRCALFIGSEDWSGMAVLRFLAAAATLKAVTLFAVAACKLRMLLWQQILVILACRIESAKLVWVGPSLAGSPGAPNLAQRCTKTILSNMSKLLQSCALCGGLLCRKCPAWAKAVPVWQICPVAFTARLLGYHASAPSVRAGLFGCMCVKHMYAIQCRFTGTAHANCCLHAMCPWHMGHLTVNFGRPAIACGQSGRVLGTLRAAEGGKEFGVSSPQLALFAHQELALGCCAAILKPFYDFSIKRLPSKLRLHLTTCCSSFSVASKDWRSSNQRAKRIHRADPWQRPKAASSFKSLPPLFDGQPQSHQMAKLDDGWPESEEKYSKICICEDRIAWKKERKYMKMSQRKKMWMFKVQIKEVRLWRCEDVRMWRDEDVRMWRDEDVSNWRCEDVMRWRCEHSKMWGCDEVKMWICEDVMMWGWEDVQREKRRHRRFCNLLHTSPCTHRHFYTPFTHRPFYTQTLLQTNAFTHRRFFTETPLHKDSFTHYFVLQSSHKVRPSTSSHQVRPSTTSYYKARTKYVPVQARTKYVVPVLLRTTKLAQSTSQYKLAPSTSQYYFVLQSLHKVRQKSQFYRSFWRSKSIEPHFVRKGCRRPPKTRNFTSVLHFVRKGCRGPPKVDNFSSVFDDRTSCRAKGLRRTP